MEKYFKYLVLTIIGVTVAAAIMIILVTFVKDIVRKDKEADFVPIVTVAIPPNMNVDSFIVKVVDSLNKNNEIGSIQNKPDTSHLKRIKSNR